MARRKRKQSGDASAERLIPKLRAAVKLLDEALGKLAPRGSRTRRRRG